jgi:hypothetical protein
MFSDSRGKENCWLLTAEKLIFPLISREREKNTQKDGKSNPKERKENGKKRF